MLINYPKYASDIQIWCSADGVRIYVTGIISGTKSYIQNMHNQCSCTWYAYMHSHWRTTTFIWLLQFKGLIINSLKSLFSWIFFWVMAKCGTKYMTFLWFWCWGLCFELFRPTHRPKWTDSGPFSNVWDEIIQNVMFMIKIVKMSYV